MTTERIELPGPVPTVQCRCGAWTGEPCRWSGPTSEMVTVEYMPEHLRSQHQAAGNSGSYPYNGAMRVTVSATCADRLLNGGDGSDDGWAWIVEAER